MNKIKAKVFEEGKGFNRYMVECEYRNSDCGNQIFIVLIDTWWNVNVEVSGIVASVSLVLIDTWWNVNKAAA